MPPRIQRSLFADFYRVQVPDGEDFGEILESVAQTPNDKRRNVDARGTPVRLHESHGAPTEEGDLVKIRMDEVPVKASLSGSISPFALGSDEGVGEQTAFLYDATLETLVLQRNRYGVSASAFANYFETLTSIGPIILEPILQEDALKKLQRLSEIRKFQVRVAGADARVFKDQAHGAKEMAQLISAFGAPNISLELSMGYSRGSLLLDRAKAAARRFLSLAEDPSGGVTGIVITGTSDASERTVLDLLNYRMEESIDVPKNGRELKYSARRVALKQALGKRRQELKRMFASEA